MAHFVVVGGGQAGASLVERLRTQGFDGRITLLGAEPEPPYQRPPLSKAYLKGDMARERLFLRPADWYAAQGIELRTGARVDAIDPAARTVSVGDETLSYDQLALTTGSRPRPLPARCGGDLRRVFPVRSLADIDALAQAFAPGKRVLIVGGGYIGLEAAAVAAESGLEVTVVELSSRILQRTSAPETSDWFRDLHRRHGVTVLEDTSLATLTGDGHVTGARLGEGRAIGVDLAILGMGIQPRTDLAEAAGLVCDNGIAVDALGRTSDPSIWAAGDCAALPFRGGRIRLESVQNAIDGAGAVADNMLGAGTEYDPKPWFWSDQYDVKLQIAGLNVGYDRVVRRADSHWYYRGDTLLAVDAMGAPRTYMTAKRLIEAGRSPPPDVIADPATDLKVLLRP